MWEARAVLALSRGRCPSLPALSDTRCCPFHVLDTAGLGGRRAWAGDVWHFLSLPHPACFWEIPVSLGAFLPTRPPHVPGPRGGHGRPL